MRKILIIMIIVLVVVSLGCSTAKKDPITDTKLQSGKTGLELSFLDKSIPDEVYEGNRINLPVEVWNNGFYDIEGGILVLQNIDEEIMLDELQLPEGFVIGNNDKIIRFSLKGKSINNKNGDKRQLNAIFTANEIYDTLNKKETEIRMDGCYPYVSVLSETICIDTKPTEEGVIEKSCKAKDITTSGGQGAPVEISKIEQVVSPGKDDRVDIRFKITAKNSGKGRIVDVSKYEEACLGKPLEKEDYNSIRVKSLKFSDFYYSNGADSDFICTPNPLKENSDGEYTTICELKESATLSKTTATFQTQIVVELEYGYKISVKPERISILNKRQD